MTGPRIRVRNATAGTPISPDLWGVFFEDINYSADGGLYAELIQNRSFEYTDADHAGWNGLTCWTLEGNSGQAALSLSTADPFNAATPHYAIVNATSDSAKLLNSGFDGISVVAGETYRLHITARQLAGMPGAIRARLQDRGEVVALGDPIRLGHSWEQATAELTAIRSSPSASLALEIEQDAKVAIDTVSLFPTSTFRDGDSVLRADLACAIAELHPRFIRFPGGCVAHGLGLDNIYRWSSTVGPLESRHQMFNLWGYHQSMGLGYFEYFQYCEQIGAKPLPVLAAGVCCQNLDGGAMPVADDHMGEYIAEVLGLIEYANGPASSRWGALRAAAGHPEPFGLEYLAIGNEDQQTAIFRNRFSEIYEAIRDQHPEITVVGTVGPAPFGSDYEAGWNFARELGVPIVDEHSYKSPRWFFENLDRFDSYDRNGPAVYVGEYGSKGNTVLNALAEAAYMMALERNGDIVRLASYAPLLAKVDHTQWVPDLIYFDNQKVMRTANFYVQKMHSESTGDRAIPVQVEAPPAFTRVCPTRTAISVRSASANVEFSNVRLNDSDPVSVTLEGDLREQAMPVESAGADCYITLNAKLTGGADGFAIAFGEIGTPNHFEWQFGTWKNRFSTLYIVADGNHDELLEPVPFSVETGRTYRIEIRVEDGGDRIACVLDGEVMHDWKRVIKPEQRFTATAVRDTASFTTWLKVVNATPEDVAATIDFDIAPPNTVITRAVFAGEPTAGAAFEPSPVLPRVDTLTWPRGELRFAPFSFTVLQFADRPGA